LHLRLNHFNFVYKIRKMNYLNLYANFSPFATANKSGKSINFESFVFNGGEPHIKILNDLTKVQEVTITTRVRSFNDMGTLLIAADALKRTGIQKLNLVLPYFPGARQDRVMVAGEPLTVKVYADILNAVGFQKVTILDPHSEVTPAVLNNAHVVSNHAFVKECLKNESDYLLVSPDGGALKKIYKVAQFLEGKPVVECSKKRNVETGKLSGFKVYEDDLEGKTCVIVDDICDGGGTFNGLAEELKKKNCGKLILIVTHGIFSKGFEELAKSFDHIYSTDSFADFENIERFTQVKLNTNNLI